ncbi:hypothetical protein ACOSP7_028711 [Xanthoceras sorbifolium]
MTAVDAGHHNPCKRARSFCDEPLTKLGDCDRCGGDKGCCCRADGDRGGCNRGGEGRGSNDSFKYKVMNLSSWQGIRVRKDRLKIEDDDIVLTEGLYGPDVILSDELKKKLSKPWTNALILKIMGRSYSLNFMIQKLRQKWNLIGQW